MRTVQRFASRRSWKAKSACAGPASGTVAPTDLAKAPDRLVAGQDEVIAVVDHAPDLRIVIRSAAAAGLSGGVGDGDGQSGLAQGDGSGQPGEPRADDRRPCETHFVRLSRTTVQINAALDTLTRVRGAVQPAASIRASTFE